MYLYSLRVGAGVPVMATMNLPHLGVFNGTRLIVLRVHRSGSTGAPLFVVCCYWKDGEMHEVVIPRAKVVASDDMPFAWVRQQFPLQLCWAMTINKSQGQTLRSRVGVVLTSGVWAHGMAYVALGRVTDPANLRVAAPGNGTVVVNVVYHDVLMVGEARGAV
jgi:ATP-dependent exoDNAse (exonuclease V) alpha subunit